MLNQRVVKQAKFVLNLELGRKRQRPDALQGKRFDWSVSIPEVLPTDRAELASEQCRNEFVNHYDGHCIHLLLHLSLGSLKEFK